MPTIPKSTVEQVFNDVRGCTENAPKKSVRKKSLDDRYGRKFLRSLKADRKASLTLSNKYLKTKKRV